MNGARLRRLLAAACCLAAAASAGLAAEVPEPVRALDAESAEGRSAAAAVLESHPDRDALVTSTLRDPEARAALGPAALEELSRLAADHGLSFANAGLRALVRDEGQPPSVRAAAATALGRTGSLVDAAALADAVRAVPDAACRALAAIGGETALAALRRGAGAEPPPEALAAMARLGDPGGLPELIAALDDPARRARAGELLAWATGRDLPPERAAWEAHLRRRELAERLAVEDVLRAADTAEALAAELRGGGGGSLGKDLVAILEDPLFPLPAREKAALVLGLGGVREARDALLGACANRTGAATWPEGSLRLYAGEALARVGDLSVAIPLLTLLTHDEDRDRILARRTPRNDFATVDPAFVRTLFRLGVKGAVEPLLSQPTGAGLLGGEYRTNLQREALAALREISGGEDFGYRPDADAEARLAAVERIRDWWRSHREEIPLAPRPDDPGRAAFEAHVDAQIARLGAFKFIEQMRAKAILVAAADVARERIEAALAADDLHVRMGAAEVLHLAGLRASAPAIAARLEVEENPAARTKLLRALETTGRPRPGRRADERVRGAVRSALGDPQLDVRIAAASALGVVGEPGADDARLRAARARPENDVPAFRASSAGSLLALAVAEGLPDLLRELAVDDVSRRQAAADALVRNGIDLLGYDPDLPDEERRKVLLALHDRHGVPFEGR